MQNNDFGMGLSKLDRFLEANGLIGARGKWKELSFGQAKAVLQDIISNSICYGVNVIPDPESKKYAASFFQNFDKYEAKYFTNLILDKYPVPFCLHKISEYDPEPIMEDYLTSIAVVAVDPYKIGVFVRGEWD